MSVIFSPWFKRFQQHSPDENRTMLSKHKLNIVSLFCALLLILVGLDYVINQSNGNSAASELAINLPSQASHQHLANGYDIVALYQQFDQPEPEPKPEENTDLNADQGEQGMSIAQQAKQSGLLNKLYIDDAVYRLSGIVKSGKYKAALSVSYVASIDSALNGAVAQQSSDKLNRKTHISLAVGDRLGPYLVEAISSRRLTLVQQERRLWLELFVPFTLTEASKAP